MRTYSLPELKAHISSGRKSDAKVALRYMQEEAELMRLKTGFLDLAMLSLEYDDDDIWWSACAILSRFLPQENMRLFGWIIDHAAGASKEQRTALGKCLLEHIMETDFEKVITRIRRQKELATRHALVDVLSRCWPYGQAEIPSNWALVEELVAEYPDLARRRTKLFFLTKRKTVEK